MLVLFVSECEKAAWKRSRRVLSRYAVQVGRRTWLTRISTEGLEQVRRELLQGVSRNTSVACHRMRGRYRSELVWIVGTKRHFSRTGEYAFSHTEKKILPYISESAPLERTIAYLLELAALWHDMGKHLGQFQRKLRDDSARLSDCIRHERFSVLILLQVLLQLQQIVSEPPEQKPTCLFSDEWWLSQLANQQSIVSALDEVWETSNFNSALLQSLKSDIQWPSWFPHAPDGLPPLMTALCSLILSHHKLPSGQDYLPMEAGFVQFAEEIDTELNLSAQLGLLPVWQETERWAERVSGLAERLLRLQQNVESANPGNEMSLHLGIQYLARPALIFADHHESKLGSACRTEFAKNICFANTADGCRGTLAQPLSEHLLKVSASSARFYRILLKLRRRCDVPTVEQAPAALISPIDPGPFRWQQEAEQQIIKAKIPQGAGFFGIVMAETGAGKTRGNVRIISALTNHQKLRFTIALGMRSLTLQTAEELKEELTLSEDHIVTMVGSALARYWQEASRHAESLREGAGTVGSESLDLADEFYHGAVGEIGLDPDIPWPSELWDSENEKRSKFLYAPIVVCTVDHLMPFVQSPKARAAALAVRLLSGDLILDEIDSYSVKDTVPLAKLCFLAGFYGQRMIASSATAPPAIVRTFFNSYKRGFDAGCHLRKEQASLMAGWFTHLPDLQQVLPASTGEEFAELHAHFSANFVERLRRQPPRRCIQVIDHLPCLEEKPTAAAAKTAVFDLLLDHAQQLHARYHELDSYTGLRISIGAIRWNRVATCREFARYCLNQSCFQERTDFKVLCYHAKHLPLVLHSIERTLSILLNRKAMPLSETPTGKLELKRAADRGVHDLIFLVSTSPISEVGRDHDYDWGIFEPCSYWSLIQMAGRIWRHRNGLPLSAPNIALLRTSLLGIESSFRENSERLSFFRPGPESRLMRVTAPDRWADVLKVLEIADLEKSITAIPTLVEPKEVIHLPELGKTEIYENLYLLEHAVQRYYLENPARDASLQDYLKLSHPGVHYTSEHAVKNPFRDVRPRERFWYDPDGLHGSSWYHEIDNTASVRVVEDTNDYSGASLLPIEKLDKELLYEEYYEQLHRAGLGDCRQVLSFEAETNNSSDPQFFEYSNFLGWARRRASR